MSANTPFNPMPALMSACFPTLFPKECWASPDGKHALCKASWCVSTDGVTPDEPHCAYCAVDLPTEAA